MTAELANNEITMIEEYIKIAHNKEIQARYKERDASKYWAIPLTIGIAALSAAGPVAGVLTGAFVGMVGVMSKTENPDSHMLASVRGRGEKDYSKTWYNTFLDSKTVAWSIGHVKSLVNAIERVPPSEPISQGFIKFVSDIKVALREYGALNNNGGVYFDENGVEHFVKKNDKEFMDKIKKDCMLFTHDGEEVVGLKYTDGKLDKKVSLNDTAKVIQYFEDEMKPQRNDTFEIKITQ